MLSFPHKDHNVHFLGCGRVYTGTECEVRLHFSAQLTSPGVAATDWVGSSLRFVCVDAPSVQV